MMHYATKSLLLDAIRNLPRTVFNLVSWARANPSKTNISRLRNLVLSMPHSEQEPFATECRFVRNVPLDNIRALVFPYNMRGGVDGAAMINIETGREKGLPYVVLPSRRRVYFPKSTSETAMLENYRGLMFVEGITGAGLLEKSPHCYQDVGFSIEQGDCLLDIGCAEGLFTVECFGYKTRFSDGFMLIDMNGIHFPYFRKGVIYAWNH